MARAPAEVMASAFGRYAAAACACHALRGTDRAGRRASDGDTTCHHHRRTTPGQLAPVGHVRRERHAVDDGRSAVCGGHHPVTQGAARHEYTLVEDGHQRRS